MILGLENFFCLQSYFELECRIRPVILEHLQTNIDTYTSTCTIFLMQQYKVGHHNAEVVLLFEMKCAIILEKEQNLCAFPS